MLKDYEINKNHTPWDLVCLGLTDPCKVFIKNEPHKKSKLVEGRCRLIFSVNILNNAIAFLLGDNQNKKEIDYHENIPCKPGMGLHDDGLRHINKAVHDGARAFPDYRDGDDREDLPLAEADMKGWDWSFQEIDFLSDLKRRVALNHSEGTDWEKIMTSYYHCMARKVLILSDGTMYQQVLPGVMASGWGFTTPTNSSARATNAYYVAIKEKIPPWCMVQGDDGVERWVPNAEYWYAKLGKVCGMYEKVDKFNFEFCSTRFDGNLGYSANIGKIIVNILMKPPVTFGDQELRFDDLCYELRNHPDKVRWISLVVESGWRKFVSPQHENPLVKVPKVSVRSLAFGVLAASSLGFQGVSAQNLSRVLNKTPRDCTEPLYLQSLAGSLRCTVPLALRYPVQMTNNKQKKTRKAKSLVKAMRKASIAPRRKATPFADVGSILGGSVGKLFNAPGLSGVGKWLGTGIGSIFGSGDYQMVGQSPKYNILSGQIPKFSSTRATNVVCHREYLGDIMGTTAFNLTSYPLNPGVSTTFPWLSQIATSYQQYKFHGLVFEFRPLITDFVTGGAPGVVVMATNYNSDDTPYINKQQMENSEFAVSVKPTERLMHMIECDVRQTPISELYVRNNTLPVGVDKKLYDWGSFQFATQANPIQNLGELWVSYCVEFFKPELSSSNFDIESSSGHLVALNAAATTAVFGDPTNIVGLSGSVDPFITATTFGFTAVIGQLYSVSMVLCGSAVGAWTCPLVAVTSGATLKVFSPSVTAADQATINRVTGTACTGSALTTFLVATATTVVLNGSGGAYATTNSFEIIVNTVDPTVVG